MALVLVLLVVDTLFHMRKGYNPLQVLFLALRFFFARVLFFFSLFSLFMCQTNTHSHTDPKAIFDVLVSLRDTMAPMLQDYDAFLHAFIPIFQKLLDKYKPVFKEDAQENKIRLRNYFFFLMTDDDDEISCKVDFF